MSTVRRRAELKAPRAFVAEAELLGMTQAQLAKALAASEDSIGRWFTGDARVPLWALLAVRELRDAIVRQRPN